MNFAIRLLAAALAVLPVAALADTAPAPLTAETMWQLKRVGPPAISPDGKFAVYDLKRYDADNDKGDCRPLPRADRRRQAAAPDELERQRDRADLEPGRPLHRLRREARRRQAVAALRDRRERRRSDPRQRRPDRRRLAQVVPGLEAHRLHHRGLAGHHRLGQDQGKDDRARRVEDERDDLGPPAGHALGSLHRGPHPAPVFHRDRRRDARRDHAELRPVAPAARKRQGFLRHLAGRPGNRLRREHRRDRPRREHGRLRRAGDRRRGEATSPRTIPRATRSRRTARTAATSRTRSRPSRVSTATPSSSGWSTAGRMRAAASPRTGTARSAASPGRPTRSRSTRRSTTRRPSASTASTSRRARSMR